MSVAQTVSSVDQSRIEAKQFSIKLTQIRGKYKIVFGSVEYENYNNLKSIQISGDPDLEFSHFISI